MVMRGERFRFWAPVVALGLFGGYAGTMLVRAHVDPSVEELKYTLEYRLPARRGSIYGAYGKDSPFVASAPLWEYRLDPVALTNAVAQKTVRRGKEPPRTTAAILRTISDSLGLDYATVKAMAENTSKRYQFLKISSDPEAHDILANRKLVAGVAINDNYMRQYLHGRSMSHVLGSVNAEDVGSSGIELKFDRELTGVPGIVRGMKDANGHELYDKRKVSVPAKDGRDIYLTIEPNIQFEAEAALKWGLAEYGAGSGWVIVMDAATGAILAMASLPDYDPVAFGRASESAKMNRAIAFNFEPGSVMKVLTVATALEKFPKRYGPNTLYNTNRNDERYYKLPGDGTHVWNPTMTLTEAIVHSSNIVVGKLAYDLGPLVLYDSFRAFGLGQKTGVDLPGEEVGILMDPRKKMWDKASQSRAGIGQFVAVTPIQLIGAYQAIANDGVRMRPYVVSKIVDEDGVETYRAVPRELSRPVSARTARTLRKMMLDVASPQGTARRAAIKGYSIAGKTGTAQKALNGSYESGLYRASFCGIIPAGEPKLVILASLDFDQKTKFHQGGNSAGPVFRRVALAAIRYVGIDPDRPAELENVETDEYDAIADERASRYD